MLPIGVGKFTVGSLWQRGVRPGKIPFFLRRPLSPACSAGFPHRMANGRDYDNQDDSSDAVAAGVSAAERTERRERQALHAMRHLHRHVPDGAGDGFQSAPGHAFGAIRPA